MARKRGQKVERFSAGRALEREVSVALTKMGVPHLLTEAESHEDSREKIDLKILPHGGFKSFDIQLTLMLKNPAKMFIFALRSLMRKRDSVCVYLEVVSDRKSNIAALGSRVAQAIRNLVYRFRDFGAMKLLYVQVLGGSGKIIKSDLLDKLGAQMRDHVLRRHNDWKIREERRRILLEKERLERHRALLIRYICWKIEEEQKQDLQEKPERQHDDVLTSRMSIFQKMKDNFIASLAHSAQRFTGRQVGNRGHFAHPLRMNM